MISKANSLPRLRLYFELTDDNFFRTIAERNREHREELLRRQLARLREWKRDLCSALIASNSVE